MMTLRAIFLVVRGSGGEERGGRETSGGGGGFSVSRISCVELRAWEAFRCCFDCLRLMICLLMYDGVAGEGLNDPRRAASGSLGSTFREPPGSPPQI